MLKLVSLSVQKLRAMAGGLVCAALSLALAFLLFVTAAAALNKKKPDRLVIALVDEDSTAVSRALAEAVAADASSSVTLIPCAGRGEAEKLVENGAAEGMLIIPSGLENALISEKTALTFVAGRGTSSAEAASELIGAHAVKLRSRLRAELYAEQLLGRELTDAERETLSRLSESAFSGERESAEVRSIGKRTGGAAGVLGAFHARLNGFFAFTAMLLILMLGSFIGSEDSVACAGRMRTVKHGGALESASRLVALMLCGAALLLLFAVASGGLSLRGALSALAYLFCISLLSMLLGSLAGAARTDLASPFIALITSLAGGCFIDPAALGGGLKKLALFTPQGQYLDALSGGWRGIALLLGLALVFLIAGSLAERIKRA